MIDINVVYTAPDGKEYRVLWLLQDTDAAVIIELTDNRMPDCVNLSELREKLWGGIINIRRDDPYANLMPEDTLSESAKKFRDTAWGHIQKAVNDEPAIYDKNARGKILSAISEDTGVSIAALYKYLKWYWQRGKNKNALLPRFNNRGSKGYGCVLTGRKKGRPRKYGQSAGKNARCASELYGNFRLKHRPH